VILAALTACGSSPQVPSTPSWEAGLYEDDRATQAEALETLRSVVLADPDARCADAARHEPRLTTLAIAAGGAVDPTIVALQPIAGRCRLLGPLAVLMAHARARSPSFRAFRQACLKRADAYCEAWHAALITCQKGPDHPCGAEQPLCTSFCEWKGCEPWCP
jgi:hypothetical protein